MLVDRNTNACMPSTHNTFHVRKHTPLIISYNPNVSCSVVVQTYTGT